MDGVYDADPEIHGGAQLLGDVNYMDVIGRGLGVMDTTAITMCMENELPIRVFSLVEPGNITRAVRGEPVGTLIH